MVIQVLLLVAVQGHPVVAVTLTRPEPAEEVSDSLVGDMLYVQDTPSWVTVKVLPAMVIVPVRELVLEFDETE